MQLKLISIVAFLIVLMTGRSDNQSSTTPSDSTTSGTTSSDLECVCDDMELDVYGYFCGQGGGCEVGGLYRCDIDSNMPLVDGGICKNKTCINMEDENGFICLFGIDGKKVINF